MSTPPLGPTEVVQPYAHQSPAPPAASVPHRRISGRRLLSPWHSVADMTHDVGSSARGKRGTNHDSLDDYEQPAPTFAPLPEQVSKALVQSDAQHQPLSVYADHSVNALTRVTRTRRPVNGTAVTALFVAVLFPPAGLGLAKLARRECLVKEKAGSGVALLAYVIAAAGTAVLTLAVLVICGFGAYGITALGNGVQRIADFLDWVRAFA
jgi:hypothetical protein